MSFIDGILQTEALCTALSPVFFSIMAYYTMLNIVLGAIE